jgi:hypothetical protein
VAGPETREEKVFAESYTDAICGRVDACCPVLGRRPLSQSACHVQIAASVRSLRGFGTVFDPVKAAVCLATTRRENEACVFPLLADAAACIGVWHGQVPLGGHCNFTSDCVVIGGSQAECSTDDGCLEARPAAEGEPCGGPPAANHVIWRCDEENGFFCESQTRICRRVPALGEPCLNGLCAPGSWCRNVCEPLPPAGSACDPFTSGCGPAGECHDRICRGVKNPGESCDPAIDGCLLGTCVNGHCTLASKYCQ